MKKEFKPIEISVVLLNDIDVITTSAPLLPGVDENEGSVIDY